MSEAEDQVLTLERKMGPEMDLVNRPNPWLPAYGFQIQPLHANFPNTHEDLRANDAMLAQQVDFLETILEETSDDLQSDSDRSGTTYWLGSDSETESVIHIKSGQRNADEKQDGSGSECNSVVPKKRRRRNNSSSDLLNPGAASPRSSRDSSTSSRSSSLLQFESLERTCATLSPSSYSFDSLEYSSSGRGTTSGRLSRTVDASNGASSRHEACASPDSLEHEDYGQINGYYNESQRDPGNDGLFRLRPYRSFESLGEKDMMMQDRNGHLGGLLSNGFSAHAFGKNCDLSRLARRPNSRRRDPWQHVYSDYDESTNDSPENLSSEEEDEREEDDEEDYTSCRYTEVDQLLVFGDPSSTYSHAASLDCRNSVDLRDFGLDSDDERTRRETTFLDLKAAARLSLPSSNSQQQQQQQQSSEEEDVDLEGIDPSVQLRRRHHHHHHHHHHHRSSGSGGGSGGGGSLQYNNSGGSGGDNSDARQSGAGNASGGGFNFRFTDKWRSAPSLPGSLLDDVAAAKSSSFVAAATVVSNRSTYEAYTRVASVPVDLDLCGRSSRALIIDDRIDDDVQELEAKDLKSSEEVNKTVQSLQEDQVKEEQEEKESSMSEIVTMNHDGPVLVPEGDLEPGKVVGEEKARLRKRAKEQLSAGIKTQDKVNLALSSEMLNSLGSPKNASLENDDVDQVRKSPVLQTVKTQDKVESNEVLEIALAMEKDVDAVVDEAIRQLKREVEEATSQNAANVEELTAALESARRARLENLQERRRVKNNASYELAQQNMVDELSIRRRKLYHRGIEEEPPRPRRVINNASYELAQQADVMKHLPIDRRFFRMNACEEHPVPSSSSVTDLVVEMSATGSSYNLSSEYHAPASSSRQYSKSTENVSNNARQQAKQQQKEETSLLDQIKKNSDFFSTSGEDAGKASPATVLPALDDEVDYPCLLENKPIIVAHSITDKTTIKNLENDVETTREIGTEEEDSDGLQKKSFIGEFYRAATPKNVLVSKSCEEVWSNGTLRNAPADRLWGVVMEARASAAEKEKSSGGGTTPPLLASPSRSPESAARYTGSTAAGSSPAAAAERDNAIVNIPVPTTTTPVDEEASTVQPRPNAEMSATAAKRLAMSGQPTTVKSPSSTSVNTLSTTTSKEERKKGGLGGFLQRFSKLRFSGRSKVPRSEVQKKSGASGVTVEHAVQNNSTSRLQQATPSKKKNEPDYIIIPLHAPEDELRKNEEEQQLQQQQEPNDRSAPNISANGRPPACGHKKPPLPPQSLRSGGPGGSGGGGGGGGSSYGFGGVGVPAAPSRRRAATDLGNPAAIEMAKARAAMLAASSSSTVSQEPSSSQQRYFQQQRPVGLLETDLDAPEDEEASKKARSLLNLNGHPHPQLSIAPQHLDYSLVDEDAAAQATAAGAAAGNHLSHRHHHHNGQNHHHHHHHRGKAASEAAAGHQRPHKSMEFLLDKENLHFVKVSF